MGLAAPAGRFIRPLNLPPFFAFSTALQREMPDAPMHTVEIGVHPSESRVHLLGADV